MLVNSAGFLCIFAQFKHTSIKSMAGSAAIIAAMNNREKNQYLNPQDLGVYRNSLAECMISCSELALSQYRALYIVVGYHSF